MTRQSYKRLPWIRLIVTIIAVLFIAFCVGLIVGGSNSTSNDITFAILAGVSLVVGLLAWFFPFALKQSEATPLHRARELVRGSFKMGDAAASNFPYITTPIQDTYNAATRALLDASTGTGIKQGILILGEANAGKTRLAFEAITQVLYDWPVLRLSLTSALDKLPLSEKHLVIFIDDLQDYVTTQIKDIDGRVLIADSQHTTTLSTSLEWLRQNVRHTVVVATCRTENEEHVRADLGKLFNELEVLRLPHFNVDVHDPEAAQIISDFQKKGATHIEDWDGTLGSLVLGLSTKNQEYLSIRNDIAATVLRAMKLLLKAHTIKHTEPRVRAVCAEVFGENEIQVDEKVWRVAVDHLISLQFITVDNDNS